MADLEEILDTYAALVAGIVYPGGMGVDSALGPLCTKVYPGWPQAAGLKKDLAEGSINVSIYPMGSDKNVTRYRREWFDIAYAPKTLTVAVDGNTLTLGGTVSTPLNVAVLVQPATGEKRTIVYAVQPDDTLTSIATAIAALINVGQPATSAGAAVTVSSGGLIAAKVGGAGTQMRELKRQVQDFAIIVWAPTPELRKQAAKLIDAGLSKLDYITLVDTQRARNIYHRTIVTDQLETANAYRRDLVYSLEYCTTEVQGATEIVFIEVSSDASQNPDAGSAITGLVVAGDGFVHGVDLAMEFPADFWDEVTW